MKNPRLEIDSIKLKENSEILAGMLHRKGITCAAVTKAFCAIKEAAEIFKEAGMDFLADSRVSNLKKLKDIDLPKLMLRLPMISEAEDTVKYSDISLNSEIETVRVLNKEAGKLNKKHGVILMADLGDLREGYPEEDDLIKAAEEILTMEHIEFKGIGVNLTCVGGVIPDEDNLGELKGIKERLKRELNTDCEIVSGGNSSSLPLIMEGRMVPGINNLRLGESILLGRETAYGKRIEGTHGDIFTLRAEIVELKTKPSVPRGKRGVNAFGEVPAFKDRGMRRMAILALGKQDAEPHNLTPIEDGIVIVGASSDHTVIDVTDYKGELSVGSEISFRPDYAGILRLTTSQYIKKVMVGSDGRKTECL